MAETDRCVIVRRGQRENCRVVRPCRVREAHGITGAAEKSDNGDAWSQAKGEREEGALPIAGASDACIVYATSKGERCAGSRIRTGCCACGQGWR
jgi:hypothetical protein